MSPEVVLDAVNTSILFQHLSNHTKKIVFVPVNVMYEYQRINDETISDFKSVVVNGSC